MPRASTRRPLAFAGAALLLAAAAAGAVARAAQRKPEEPPAGSRQVRGEIHDAGEVQRIEEACERRLVVAADVLFAFDRDELMPEATRVLAELGSQLKEAEGKVTVEGHTDARGPGEANRALSLRRAQAVRDWLVANGFAPAGTPAAGFGEGKPVAANTKVDGSDDPGGRQKNRRVEVVVKTCPEG